MVNVKYIFSDYELKIELNNDFSITYNYHTPVTLECFHDGWQTANVTHKVVEKYSNDKKLKTRECKIDVENIHKCKVPIIDGYTNFSEKELLEQFYKEQNKKKFIDISINNDIYTKHYLTDNEYVVEFFCGFLLYFNHFDMLTGIEYNSPLRISNLTYIENGKKASLNYNSHVYKYSNNNICYTVFPDMIAANFPNGKIKRYPNRNLNEYTIEFFEDNYRICPKNMEKELYSYSGMRIDKYPLIQKDKPDESFGIKTTIQNEKFGSFDCINILGLPIGGQLDNGITYLYLYHNDGSYIKTYSDGDNRYYNKIGFLEKIVKIDIKNDGTQILYLKNGKVLTYNLND